MKKLKKTNKKHTKNKIELSSFRFHLFKWCFVFNVFSRGVVLLIIYIQGERRYYVISSHFRDHMNRFFLFVLLNCTQTCRTLFKVDSIFLFFELEKKTKKFLFDTINFFQRTTNGGCLFLRDYCVCVCFLKMFLL